MAIGFVYKFETGEQQSPNRPLTYEQFLEEADEDTFAEWVDGEVVVMSPASAEHQNLVGFLAAIFRWFAEEQSAGQVLTAPFQMRLPNVRRGREPDLLFITAAHLSRLQNNFLDGPADLVVEVVSPESVLRDRGEKCAEYEIEGVGEYWIVDPQTQRADFFVLGADGRYERAHPDATGVYHSAILAGFWLNLNWLWQRPLPTLRQVLREGDLI